MKSPLKPKINYLFAGDICCQSMRIEEKTSFPVHRYGFSFDVHRHKAITGTVLLKFLVEQCFEHDGIEKDSGPTPSTPVTPPENEQRYSGVRDWLEEAKKKRERSVNAIVWESEGDGRALKDKDRYHESVAILGETDLIEETKEGDSSLLRGFRLKATHTVSDFDEDVSKLENHFFGTPVKDSDLVLNLDVKHFGFHGEFKKLRENAPFGNLVTRLVIPRRANNQPTSKSDFNTFSEAFLEFLTAYTAKGKKSRLKNSTSVLVISSESLRNAGFDISYRVAWERSITGVLRALEPGSEKGNKDIATIIRKFDYMIVNFYNDGALLIKTSGDDKAVLVAVPSQTEGDHGSRFSGVMKGTETLITACVAYQLRREKEGWEGGSEPLKRLQTATVHGLKASRYLQSHGYSTLHQSSNFVLRGNDEKHEEPDEKFKAISAMIGKLANSKNDVLRYFWNRTRSTHFAELGMIPGAMEFLGTCEPPNSRICAWPLGDIVEILAGGYPMFGSFPPVALSIDEGRDAVEKETRKVMAAWHESGWIEVGKFQKSFALGNVGGKPDTKSFHPFWSLRTVAVKNMASALEKGTKARAGEGSAHHETVARFLLAEMMIRFGTRQLNRCGMAPGKHFDIRLLERISLFCRKQIPTPAFYGGYFEGFHMEKFIEGLTGESVTLDEKMKLGKSLSNDPWLKLPVSGSTLGIFPGFSVKKLHTIDRRDTQSYRDVRERLLGFQNSIENKPLNLLVIGGPGSGKSFAVKEILSGVYEGVREIAFLEYNVASFAGDTSSITSAFLEIQNVALQDKLPVVFWDEYDTSTGDAPLGWLGTFLGPMQDGKFIMGQSSRYLPKCVFIFAGSVFARFDQIRLLDWAVDASSVGGKNLFSCSSGAKILFEIVPPDKLMKLSIEGSNGVETVHTVVPLDSWRRAKGRDFKSRITGVLDISSVDWTTQNETIFGQAEDEDAWLFRRAAAVRNSFEMQAKHLLNREGELQIANDTLFAFLTVDRFDHGYRSIESVVRMSSLHGRAIADGSVVPAESQARAHSQTDFFHPQTEPTYDDIARKFEAAADARKKIIPR